MLKTFYALPLIALSFITFSSLSISNTSNATQPPHLPPDLTFSEYRSLVQKKNGNFSKRKRVNVNDTSGKNSDLDSPISENDELIQPSIQIGERLLAWIDHMNQLRTTDNKIRLSEKGKLRGIPIDKPLRYSPAIIQQTYQTLTSTLPDSIKTILMDNGDFSANPPTDMDDVAFVKLVKPLVTNYESGVRWKLMEPYLDYFKEQVITDVRGYFYLTKVENLSEKLKKPSELDLELLTEIKGWLVQVCGNSSIAHAVCLEEIETIVKEDGDLNPFYDRYLGEAKRNWDSFFAIQNPRSDISWNNENGEVATLPFRDPGTETIRQFVQVNSEEEWQFDSWKLKFEFTPDARTYIQFLPGVTPNVSEIGGDIITMDSNQSIEEYETKWTIRHEMGHVLGFPDCYIEFYEESNKTMISYQIDTTDLMCSRSGAMNKRIYEEFKRNYDI